MHTRMVAKNGLQARKKKGYNGIKITEKKLSGHLYRPPLLFHHGVCRLAGPALAAWHELRDHYLQTGTLRCSQRPATHVWRAFMVPKKDGGFRLVVDLRHLNKHTTKLSTTYETLKNFLPALCPQQWLVAWDIRDAFHHLRVENRAVSYFQFQVNSELFEALGLTFGWTNSPPVFTKTMRAAVAFLRAPRAAAPRCPTQPALKAYWTANPAPTLSPYMDDFVGGLPGRAETRRWGHL